ncbi:MAG: hypothetical protein KKA62_05850 [Nanoarchaeota archaeon]|nr:hypothetical protein [Nanoarchaeota archaeon]MBU1643855.1 hypothetical protein [Nanoarchaeota archaeon]MBU1977447.1 hypothetical protein [Nanoarchaeota archaeon]
MAKYLQKMFAVLVLAIFVMSIVPAALANGKSSNDNNSVSISYTENEDQSEGTSTVEGLVKAKVQAKERIEKAEEKIEDVKERLLSVRESYLKAKEKYEETKEKHKELVAQLSETRKKVKSCLKDSDDCTEKNKELRRDYNQYLLRVSDVILSSLEKLSVRVEDVKEISDENREKALAEIADVEDRLKDYQTKVGSFSEETPKEEVLAALKELKEFKGEVRKIQKKLVALMMNSKLKKIVDKHDEFRNGMESRMESLKEQGADISKLEDLLEEFDGKSAELKEHFDYADGLWEKITTAQDFDGVVKEWHEAQKTVREDLQETKEILRKFIHEFKEIKKGLNGESSEDSVEEA